MGRKLANVEQWSTSKRARFTRREYGKILAPVKGLATLVLGYRSSKRSTLTLGLLLTRGRAGSIELHAAGERDSAPRSIHNQINLSSKALASGASHVNPDPLNLRASRD